MTNQLAAKIAKAALDVGGKLSADKTNTEQRYDYISADKILTVCGQALFSQGLVILPDISGQEVKLFEYTDQYGKSRRRYDAQVNFIFHVSDGEETQAQNWYGMGSDYTVPDKALYKAITSGHKYFLMKLLCVGAGNEDGEHEDERPTTGSSPPAQASVSPAQRARQPKPVSGPDPGWTEPEKAKEPSTGSQPANGNGAPMTFAEACAIENSAGVAYGEIPTDKLSHMANSIAKVASPTPEHERKLLAIQIILAERSKPVTAAATRSTAASKTA